MQLRNSMKYSIKPYLTEDLSEEKWVEITNLYRIIDREVDSEAKLTSIDNIKKLMLMKSENYIKERYMVVDENDKLLGLGGLFYPNELSIKYDESKNIAETSIIVLPEFRNNGIGSNFLKVLIKRAKEIGKNRLQGDFILEESRKFAIKKGCKIASERHFNRLYITDIDWGKMHKWCKDGKACNPNYSIEIFSITPESIIDEFCRVYTTVGRQAPDYDDDYVASEQMTPDERRLNEKEWDEIGETCYELICKNEKNEIIGFTELFTNKNNPEVMIQELTGVLKNYRGKGIGKWIKAEMLFLMKDKMEGVKYIVTGNADKNIPMTKINNEMGFKPHNKHYLVTLDI